MAPELNENGDALSKINYTPDSPGSTLDEIVRSVLKQFNIDELVEKVSGDNEKLAEVAQKWRDEAKALRGVVEDLQAERKTLQRGWIGPASKAFGLAANTFELALLGEADDMDTTAELLELAAMECEEAERLMLDLVVELVQSIMVTAATSAILSLITLGASAAIGAVISGANIAYRAARGVRIAAQLAERLARLSRRMRVRQRQLNLKFNKIKELKEKKKDGTATREEVTELKQHQKDIKNAKRIAGYPIKKTLKEGLEVEVGRPIKEAAGDEAPEITEKRNEYDNRPHQRTFEERIKNPKPAPQMSIEEAFG